MRKLRSAFAGLLCMLILVSGTPGVPSASLTQMLSASGSVNGARSAAIAEAVDGGDLSAEGAPEAETQAPTVVPTEAPTKAPTPEPAVTDVPATEPTETQTSTTPGDSTPEPLDTPADMPSESPSIEPSESPSETPEMSESPTPSPTPALATAITLCAETTTIAVGDTLLLSVAVEPLEAAAQPVLFTSGDETIATVDETGLVTGVAEGQAMITAAAQDGSGVSGTITIAVLAAISFAGEGTAESPYELTSSDDMHALTEAITAGDLRYPAAHYRLNADINLDGNWLPIGTAQTPFTGTFDGQGHKIYQMNTPSVLGIEGYGLFGVTSGATLTRVAVESASLDVEGESGRTVDVGLIIGRMNDGTLTLSYSTGAVKTAGEDVYAGGLVGRQSGGTISDCFSLATVSGAAEDRCGVLVGIVENGSVMTGCYHRSDPLKAGELFTVGQKDASGATIQKVYNLSLKASDFDSQTADSDAKALNFYEAEENASYAGFDFENVWSLSTKTNYPFPVLKENVYTGDVTQASAPVEKRYTGLLPTPESVLSKLRGVVQDMPSTMNTLPSSYDLRKVINMPAVRNQNPYGTCWAHANVAALETNLIKQGLAGSSINLSELHTLWYADRGAKKSTSVWEDPLNNFSNDHPNMILDNIGSLLNGGYVWAGIYCYANGMTPSAEDSTTSYTQTNASRIASSGLDYSYAFNNARYHIKGARFAFATGQNSVKQMVMDYGAVTVSYNHVDSYMAGGTYAYYAPPGTAFPDGTGHAVTIVGWDDNYSRLNFASRARPAYNGAWIIRNSWGSSYGLGGYFYASYYGAGFNDSLCIAYIGERSNDYTYCYQYDGSSNPFIAYSYRDSPLIYQANVFKVSGTYDQVVTDVGFHVSGMTGVDYRISVYKLNTNYTRPTDGTLISTATVYGETGLPGYYKVPVGSTRNLKSGDMISVVLRLQSFSVSEPVYFDVDEPATDNDLNEYSYAKSRQSYVSTNGYDWLDLNDGASSTTADFGTNNRLKIFTAMNIPVTGVSIASEGGLTKIAKGSTLQFSASVLPSEANQKVTWSVISGGDAASIDANGLLTGTGSGTVTVRAATVGTDASGSRMQAMMDVSVYIAATDVTISPTNARIMRDTTERFTATVSPAGASQAVRWSIQSGAAYATINATTGVLNANAAGTVTVAATSEAIDINGNQVQGTAQVEVFVPVMEFASLSISKESTVGEVAQLSAELLPADANQSVTYSVVNETGAATVDASGKLTCTKAGTVTVTATSVEVTPTGEHMSQSLPITIHPNVTEVVVRPSIASLADASGDIHVSQGQQFTLTGSTLPAEAVQRIEAWRMSGAGLNMYMGTDHNVLSLTASTTITTPATSVITATSLATMSGGNEASKTLNVTIHTPVSEIAVHSAGNAENLTTGRTLQMSADIAPQGAYQGVVWSVANGTGSATITQSGLLSPVSLGTVTVTATACTQTADQQTLESSKVITIRPYATSLSITAADNSTSVTKDATVQMSAAVLPAACEQTVVWSVLNGTGSATIDAATGLLTGVTGGTITVKAESVAISSSGQTLTATKPMTVDAPVKDITLATFGGATDVPLMSTLQCNATVTPSDANQAVRWSVQNGTGAATITPDGLLTGTGRGTVTVTLESVGKNSSDQTLSKHQVITVTRPLNPVTAINVSSTQDYAGIGLPNLRMQATLTPTNATVQHVTWSVENGTGRATISTDGVLTALAEGTVNVRATSDDGENISGTKTITIRDIFITVSHATGQTRLRAGESLQLAAAMTPAEVGEGAVYQWSLTADGASYATVDQTGLLTAKAPLTEAKAVTVNAAAADGRARAGTYTVTVYPAVSAIVLRANAADVTGGKVDINVTKMPEAGYMDVQVTAETLPTDANDGVSWSLSPCDGATLTADGNTATVRVTAECMPTLTATATDGTGVASTTLINAYPGPAKVLVSGNQTMSAGGHQTLVATVYPLHTPDASYTYSIVSGNATIQPTGTMYVPNGTEGQTVVVRATSVDPTVYGDFTVSVQPAATSLQVEAYLNGEYKAVQSFDDLYIASVNDEGIRIRVTPMPLTANRDYAVSAYYTNIIAVQRIGMSDEYIIKPVGYGSATVKIESASQLFYLDVFVSEYVKSIQIGGPKSVSPGKSIQLTADVQPATAFNCGVKWSIDGDGATAATISTTGVLRCKTVSGGALTVRATAADGGGAYATYAVEQLPSPSQVTVLDESNSELTALTLDCSSADPVILHAQVLPHEAYQAVLWSAALAKIIACKVNPETGALSVKPIANGSTTISVSTAEGSARKATVKVKVITSAQSVQPVGMAYDGAASQWKCSLLAGKSLSLKADVLPVTTSNKGITWSLAGAYPGVTLSGSTLKTSASAAGQTVLVRGLTTDGSAISCECAISIGAASSGAVTVAIEWNGENVAGRTIERDMATEDSAITLTAKPENIGVLWSASPATTAKLVVNADGSVTVTPLKIGNVTLSATATDGSKAKGTVKLSIVSKVKAIQIAYPQGLAKGKRVKPTVTLNPVKPSYQKIEWQFVGEKDAQYATLSATTGEVKALVDGQSVRVQAFAWVDSKGTVKIPSNIATIDLTDTAVSAVVIRDENGRDVSKKTISFRPNEADCRFSASTLPDVASGEILWTLSSNSVMTLTEDPETNDAVIHATGNGSATLKAAALDGSGKSAQITLKASSTLAKVMLVPDYPVFRVDGTLIVKMMYAPTTASTLRSTWEMQPKGRIEVYRYDSGTWHENELTILDAGGCEPGESILVTCTATTGASESIRIPVVSSPAFVDIYRDGTAVSKAALPLAMDAELTLTAAAAPDTAYQLFKWESLTPGIATVAPDEAKGLCTVKRIGSGVATIRATAMDGSGKTAYVLITEP